MITMMKSKRGMTQEQLVLMIIALVMLAILIYLAYNYVLKNGENAVKLGDCESKPPQKCYASADQCKSGQAFKVGCPDATPYCCVPPIT
jgi:hypothetical protein